MAVVLVDQLPGATTAMTNSFVTNSFVRHTVIRKNKIKKFYFAPNLADNITTIRSLMYLPHGDYITDHRVIPSEPRVYFWVSAYLHDAVSHKHASLISFSPSHS